MAWKVPQAIFTEDQYFKAAVDKLRSLTPSTQVVSNKQHRGVDSKEDDEDEGEHGGETDLEDAPVADLVDVVRGDEDGSTEAAIVSKTLCHEGKTGHDLQDGTDT